MPIGEKRELEGERNERTRENVREREKEKEANFSPLCNGLSSRRAPTSRCSPARLDITFHFFHISTDAKRPKDLQKVPKFQFKFCSSRGLHYSSVLMRVSPFLIHRCYTPE